MIMKFLRVRFGEKFIDNPTWSQTRELLEELNGGFGQFDLEWYEAHKSGGMESLTGIFVEGGDGWYRPDLSFDTKDGPQIRAYKNPKADDSWVELAGYEYPLEVVTDDFNLIIKMVGEFYESGTVKGLNHIYDYTKSDRV